MPFVRHRKRLLSHSILALLVGIGTSAQAGEFEAHGSVALGLQDAPAAESWLRGGIGRYVADGDSELSLQAQLGLRWTSGLEWESLLHLRADTRAGAGNALGVVEARIARHFFLQNDTRFSLTAGQMFLPTSREAIDGQWQSRYTLNLSALNSWIAEEIRPIGIQAALRGAVDSQYQWELGVTTFGGNDSAGALLAWRGFTLHDRLGVFNETLPLPSLPSLADGGGFAGQNDTGTKPLGRDLDGRAGYAAHARWGRAEQFQLRGSIVDTRGDRELHRGEYAWDTRFSLIGADWQPHPQLTLASEWMYGRSGMGRRGGPAFVDIDFDTFYVLTSWASSEDWRWSVRWDRFEIEDRDLSATEDNSDRGHAVTLSMFWTPRDDWRFAAEWTDTRSTHAVAIALGAAAETGGDTFRLEVRYRF